MPDASARHTTPTTNTGEPSWVQPSQRQIELNEPMYEIAYEEAKRTLDDQSDTLGNLRNRVAQFLAFVGSATAFLVGASVRSVDRHGAYYTFAIMGTALSLLTIALVLSVLNPWSSPITRRVRPGDLMAKWIETDVPIPNKSVMLRELSLHYEEYRLSNEVYLRRLQVLYAGA